MYRREQVIGIVSSWDIRWRESEGYALLITDSRLVGASLPAVADDFRAYFAPGKERDPKVDEEAGKRAEEISRRKDFELQRDHIIKIIYYGPGMLFGGRLLFATVGRKIDVSITVISGWNPGIVSTMKTLVSSLLAFAPERLYDEKTGARIRDETSVLS
ncbi:MAG: hypothetical protein OK449_00395 [Thaumarchaeota archaeon]|nr:hypothetical protein [Nitrososphaerota archaeon]